MGCEKVNLEERSILVTGATGFLGGRLTEQLLLSNKQIKVRALVHNPHHASRISNLPLERVFGDITSLEAMCAATQGCDAVVHCALSNPAKTVRGTECIIRAALANRVKKFIHISSVAVYSYSPSAESIKNEVSNYRHTGDSYCDSKIDSEKIAFSYYDSKKLPLVVLRPSNIFGPYSKTWTIDPIDMLKRKSCVLINGGFSPSNVVFVDNVVDAIKAAIENDDEIGQAFNISSDKVTDWRTFFLRYAKMFVNPPPVLNIKQEDVKAERQRQYSALLKKMVVSPRQIPAILTLLSDERKIARLLVSLTPNLHVKNRAISQDSFLPSAAKINFSVNAKGANSPILNHVPNRNLEKLFTLPYQYPIINAMNVLGYKPRVSFEEGMRITEEWAKYHKLV